MVGPRTKIWSEDKNLVQGLKQRPYTDLLYIGRTGMPRLIKEPSIYMTRDKGNLVVDEILVLALS